MNFDLLVNIIILFLFLLLPVIIRRRWAKKKSGKEGKPMAKRPKGQTAFQRRGAEDPAGRTGAPPAKSGKGFFLFRIRDQIQAFLMELEAQADNRGERSEKTFWDGLAESAPPPDEPMASAQGAPVQGAMDQGGMPKTPPGSYGKMRREKGVQPVTAETVGQGTGITGPGVNRAARLRKAVIWSEILSKPVSLQDG